MLVLDTDLLTIVQRGTGAEYARLIARLHSANLHVAVTIISFEEQMRGWLAWIARDKSQERQVQAYSRLRSLLEDFSTRPVVDYDARASKEYQRLTKLKVRIGAMDLKIAAIALVHEATLLSRNTADFRRVPGLRVEDWTVAGTE